MASNLAQISDSATEQDEIEERITRVENALQSINKQLTSLNKKLDTEPENVNNNRPVRIERTQEEIAQIRLERTQALEELTNPSISYDPQWSPYTEEKVLNAFSENGGLALAESSSVQCGATACKVTATLPESMRASQRDVYQMAMIIGLGSELPHTAGGKTIKQSDGSYVTTLYMGRRDHAFPRSED